MAIETIKTMTIDLKSLAALQTITFIQQDNNLLDITILDNGVAAQLYDMSIILVNFKRPDNTVFTHYLSAIDGNKVTYTLTEDDMAMPGVCEAEIKFYSRLEENKKVSTRRFNINLLKELGSVEVPESNPEVSVLRELMEEVKNSDLTPVSRLITATTEGQTYFDLLDIDYIPGKGQVKVEIDGVRQYGFTESSSNSITLAEGVPMGSKVTVILFEVETSPVSNTGYLRPDQTFTATSGQTVFVINGTYLMGQNHINVWIDGVPQEGYYEENSSNSITVDEPLVDGQEVYIEWFDGLTEFPRLTGHKNAHEKDGYDEIDVTKLKNYDEQIANKFNERKTFTPTYGSNWSTGDFSSSLTNAQIDNDLGLLATIPNRPLLLVFHLALDENDDLYCVQYDLADKGHSEAKVQYGIDKLEELGMYIWGIKIHTNHKYVLSDVTDFPKYWTQYTQQCERIADKFVGQGIEYMSISNEFPDLTSSATHQTDLNNVITAIKAKGYKVGFTYLFFTEADTCLHKANLDFMGFNVYPPASDDIGIDTPLYQTIVSWDYYKERLKEYKKTYPTKLLMISETSSTDFVGALAEPGRWDWPPGHPQADGKIVGKFWEGALVALHDNTDIGYVFGWDFQLGFSPFRRTYSADMMKKYLLPEGV